ncbi:MAG TPA: glycoside hydrolase family 15 protein [Acidothermaceae bacterium]
MALRIEDYALIGDTRTCALVGVDGSIDWLCLPRFDSGAVFAALLGTEANGRWQVAPDGAHRTTQRRYRPDTLVLETEFATGSGLVRVVDCMVMNPGDEGPQLVRLVEGVEGTVAMRSDVVFRPDYGQVLPWFRRSGRRLAIYAGPDAVALDGDVAHTVVDDAASASFTIGAGQRLGIRLAWMGTSARLPQLPDVAALVERTAAWWCRWAAKCSYAGIDRDAVMRSLITLKALSYTPSGGIVAAPTTSLPERLGGVRNWDYRYCWLRDATYTLLALMDGGYTTEAAAWRDWLLRAVAGHPKQMQIMYGLDGERRLTETEIGWLPGYAGSAPVRVGNAAHSQRQLDVYGEVMDALHHARANGLPPDDDAWTLQVRLMNYLETIWAQPDNGIWEVRGKRQHFVHSKVMAWVAFDRAIKGVEAFGFEGPVDQWRQVRRTIFDEVCERGYDPKRKTFTQYYGSDELDAATLLIASVGFLPADDERIVGTVAAIEQNLLSDGFVQRYTTDSSSVDGLPPGEGAFLMCTFWLADNYTLAGRHDEARALFDRLLALRTATGLLSEEYDTTNHRLVGNFPQAFSHVALITTALSLAATAGPAQRRGTGNPT